MVDTKVRIVNALGNDVERNSKEQGEIIVKGSGVMNQQQQMSSDGWVHTGDIGTMDESGHINMIKMNKDITKHDGDPVSSFEVESVLYKHPAVREIVVLATPDQELGDRKSTRLNSSHVAISYAVFCLQKKKNLYI